MDIPIIEKVPKFIHGFHLFLERKRGVNILETSQEFFLQALGTVADPKGEGFENEQNHRDLLAYIVFQSGNPKRLAEWARKVYWLIPDHYLSRDNNRIYSLFPALKLDLIAQMGDDLSPLRSDEENHANWKRLFGTCLFETHFSKAAWTTEEKTIATTQEHGVFTDEHRAIQARFMEVMSLCDRTELENWILDPNVPRTFIAELIKLRDKKGGVALRLEDIRRSVQSTEAPMEPLETVTD